MRLDLPLTLALAARANAFFRGETGRMEVLAGHPAFVRFNDLAFVRQTGLGGEIVAEGSLPWYRRLRNEGIARVHPTLAGLRLDKALDAPWGLLTEGDRGLELWSVGVGRRFQGHDDLQPYRATFTSGRFDRWAMKPPVSVNEAGVDLCRALAVAKDHLEAEEQSLAASAVGKFLALHEMECPDLTGDLACVVADLLPCARALFASGARVLALIETTGWMAGDESSRAVAAPLWAAARTALETAL